MQVPIARLLLQAMASTLGALPWRVFRGFLPAWHLQEGAVGLRNKSDMIVFPGLFTAAEQSPLHWLTHEERGGLDSWAEQSVAWNPKQSVL